MSPDAILKDIIENLGFTIVEISFSSDTYFSKGLLSLRSADVVLIGDGDIDWLTAGKTEIQYDEIDGKKCIRLRIRDVDHYVETYRTYYKNVSDHVIREFLADDSEDKT